MIHNRIKIVMADDHNMFRTALMAELVADPRIEVVGGAVNGKELLELLHHVDAHVVLLDLEMPVMDGHKTLECIKQEFPHIKVIIVSGHFNFSLVNKFMDEGAAAYLPRNVDAEVLLEAIHIVHNHEHYLKILDSLPEDREASICGGGSSDAIAKVLAGPRDGVDVEPGQVCATSERTLFAVRTGLISIQRDLFLM